MKKQEPTIDCPVCHKPITLKQAETKVCPWCNVGIPVVFHRRVKWWVNKKHRGAP